MRQFDVFAARTSNATRPYLVVLQHDATSHTETIIVAPCASAASGLKTSRAAPTITVQGTLYRVLVPEMSAIQRRALSGRSVANVAQHRDDFTAAIDLLFTGA